MAQVTTGELLEVVEQLAIGLAIALRELEQLREVEMPLPDVVLKQLEQRDAATATLRWLLDREEGFRAEAETYYREALAKACRTDDGARIPVADDVLAELSDLMELIRRRRLTSSVLDVALRDLDFHTDFAGCC